MKSATVESCRFRQWRQEKQDCSENRKYNHWLYFVPIGIVLVLQGASGLRFNPDTFLMCENSEDSLSLPVHTHIKYETFLSCPAYTYMTLEQSISRISVITGFHLDKAPYKV